MQNQAADRWATAQMTAKEIAAEMIAGKNLSYEQADELGDQVIDEIRKALRREGYELDTSDTEVICATVIEA
jgi:CheY-specific phosphatase CheX